MRLDSPNSRVLLCVPDPLLRDLLVESLHLEGLDVVVCDNVPALLTRLSDPGSRQLVVLDYFAGQVSGELPPAEHYVDLVARLAPLILLMDWPGELRLYGQPVPVAAVFPRPFPMEDLLTSIRTVDTQLPCAAH
jgi:hypothetical protein